MKSISKIWVAFTLLFSLAIHAQSKSIKTETVKIFGNCDICKTNIEKAGNLKKVATVNWNKDSKIATLTYDSQKTNQDEILKRIALAGYDSEKFLAPDNAYAALPECCRYNRDLKPDSQNKAMDINMKTDHMNHDQNKTAEADKMTTQNTSQLKAVFDHYFSLKNALVKTDANTTSSKASEMIKAIKAVEMTKLSNEEHMVWMKVMNDLTTNAEKISSAKDVAKQRETFAILSKNMYDLAKVSKQGSPVYYQHCPMYNNGKGADWLSLENEIKNPYFGSQMITCGSTVETLGN
ncbi:DUF3347 domain-containing protein [Chryseobacterium paridis]|uniref:DUF3347 domain-containing protein n=1 Tax=Chryseobacterium paridis TaxID=2800328 RepID=A0ABS1FWI7_9FLAO|nr:DUF3347 domain-containing protein [Chryseobacterium paridis]MBK1896698.1 DUF3347 domain-containing protein [Chryseobacterium paridis]